MQIVEFLMRRLIYSKLSANAYLEEYFMVLYFVMYIMMIYLPAALDSNYCYSCDLGKYRNLGKRRLTSKNCHYFNW